SGKAQHSGSGGTSGSGSGSGGAGPSGTGGQASAATGGHAASGSGGQAGPGTGGGPATGGAGPDGGNPDVPGSGGAGAGQEPRPVLRRSGVVVHVHLRGDAGRLLRPGRRPECSLVYLRHRRSRLRGRVEAGGADAVLPARRSGEGR